MQVSYTRTFWKDHMIDERGNVLQQGTPVDALHLNNLEEGVSAMDMTEEQLEEMLDEVLV